MRVISKKYLKKDNAFTGQDILIAVFIMLMFLSLTSSIFINLSNTSFEIKKTEEVTKALTTVAERIDTMDYEELEITKDETPITELSEFKDFELPKKVEIFYQVDEKLEDTDRLKEIRLIAKYSNTKSSNQVDFFIYKRLIESGEESKSPIEQQSAPISTYAAITPYANEEKSDYPFNKPEVPAGYMPVKFVWTEVNTASKKGYWVKTTEDDKEWYSIEEGIYPTFIKEAGTQRWSFDSINKTYNVLFLDMTGSFEMQIWLPKVVGNQNNFGYAYNNTNRLYYPLSTGGYGVQPNNTDDTMWLFGTANGKFVKYSKSNSSSAAWNVNDVLGGAPAKLKNSILNMIMHDKEALNKMSY